MSRMVYDIQYQNGKNWIPFFGTPVGMYEANPIVLNRQLQELQKKYPKRKLRLTTVFLNAKNEQISAV